MIILSFDSTAKIASAAVSDGDRLLALYNVDNGLTQSELLLPMAENMLHALHLSFSDVGLLACSVGPGSFTGVRIGAALVKGIAFGKDIPCVSVSTTEALAENLSGLDGLLVPVMDARRGQVYTAIFESGKEPKRLSEDLAISIDELCERLSAYPEKKIFLAGDGYGGAFAALSEKKLDLCDTPPLLREENAYSIARVAYRKYKAGEVVTDREIAPTYLRLPQAERERLEKEKLMKEGNKE